MTPKMRLKKHLASPVAGVSARGQVRWDRGRWELVLTEDESARLTKMATRLMERLEYGTASRRVFEVVLSSGRQVDRSWKSRHGHIPLTYSPDFPPPGQLPLSFYTV